jgi:hypothetical protein
MLDEIEAVTFLYKGQEYDGQVLGCEKEYFWLLVSELNSVYVGHPDRVYTYLGKRYFDAFDHHQTANQLFGDSTEPESYIFEYSQNPENIKRLLKINRLLGVI